jgi:hypothetical protein
VPHHRSGPYHPTTAARHDLLRTKDATAMAVGGMIGGGIFSVLGVAITLATIGALACAAAIVALVVELARDDVAGLVVLVALVVLITAGRVLFQRRTPARV